jgi:hypothetical protein
LNESAKASTRAHVNLCIHSFFCVDTRWNCEQDDTGQVGSGQVGSDRLGRPEESLREWPNRSCDWWFQYGTRLFLGLLGVSSGISTHIIATGIGCFFAHHHAGKDFYFVFIFSYFSKSSTFFSIFFCSWSDDDGTSEFFSTPKFANISEKYGELRLV